MRSSQVVEEGLGVAGAAPVLAFERGVSYTAGGGSADGDVGAVVANADEDALGGALASLPPVRLARVLGAAVAPLSDEAAAASLRAAGAHLDEDAAGAVCAELTATWSSQTLLSLAETVMTRVGHITLGGAVDDAALHDSIARLQRLATRAEAEKLRRLREVAERGSHLGAGARRPADLLARLGLTSGEARQQADLAKQLADLPKTGQALAQGRIGLGQATEAAKALADAKAHARDNHDDTGEAAGGDDSDDGAGRGQDTRGRVEAEREAIDDTVGDAREGTDRRQTRQELERLAARRSRSRLAEAERRAYRKRHGRKFRDGDCVTIKLSGPGADTQKIWTMIQALARPKEAGEERTQEQRNYDAAVQVADRYLAEGRLPEVNGLPAQLLLIASHDAFHDVDDAEPPTVDGLGPVSSDTAKMLCCQAEWHVVVTGGDGEPLRVGRVRYQPNRAQRRAVIARDKGCVGCGAPAARCQIHHVRWWRRGGRTDITNLVLLCANCHTHVHHHDWTITLNPDGRYHAHPPTTYPSAQPAGKGPPTAERPPATGGPPAEPATSRPPAHSPPTILSLLDPPQGAASTPTSSPSSATLTRRRTR